MTSSGSIPTPTAANVADACVRLNLPVRLGPPGLRPLVPRTRLAGPAVPVTHAGSVDVFLEAIDRAAPGGVLVIDNAGRLDEGCFGDMIGIEATTAGLAGIVCWGAHRDSGELETIGLPVFSLGACPAGPRATRARAPGALDRAGLGPEVVVTAADWLVADDDGVVVVPRNRLDEVLPVARAIAETERRQAELVRAGDSLRRQLELAEYLAARRTNPELDFRAHLRAISGAIEE